MNPGDRADYLGTDPTSSGMPQGCAGGRYEVTFNGERYQRYKTPIEAEIVAAWLRSLGWRAHAFDRALSGGRLPPNQQDIFN